jgi:hypothetical protein
MFYRIAVLKEEPLACGTAMCDKCQELDKKIQHYRSLMARVTDQLMKEGLGKLIEDMQAQKAAHHPSRKSKAASVGTCPLVQATTFARPH